MAASILLCVGLLGWGSGAIPGRDGVPTVSTASVGERYDADARRREVVLRDGSRVLIDAHSSISVSQTGSRRDVALLSGQAFFRVVHDASRPFVVAADGRTVTATGTAFGVSVIANRMSVVLEEGAVKVASDAAAGLSWLRPGQTYVAESGHEGTVSDVDVAGELAWRTGYVELHDVTIGEAVERMNRYTETPVRIGDPAAAALRITGQFRTDDPIRFVETLSELYPVRIKRSSNGVMEIVSVKNRRER